MTYNPDCTLLLVVDDSHLDELVCSLPTWYVCHSEIASFPVVLMYDVESVSQSDVRIGLLERVVRDFGNVGSFRKVPWPTPDVAWDGHREKMLLAYVHGASYVDTKWFLKIDTDAIGSKRTASFLKQEWFDSDVAFVSNPRYRIDYTLKQLPRLEAWAKNVPFLSEEPTPDYAALRSKRTPIKVCSWLMFGNTEWFNLVAKHCSSLPVPSQDSFHSYVAMKYGARWVPVEFSKLGWDHKISKSVARSPLLDKCPGILKKYGYEVPNA